MTTQLVPSRTRDPGPRTSRWERVAAWTLLAALAALGAVLVLFGERQASLSDLQARVAAGDVTEVGLSEGLPADAVGRGTVRVRWRGQVLDQVTTVVQASDAQQARLAERQGRAPVVVGDVAEALGLDAAGVRIVEIPPWPTGSSTTFMGIMGPAWTALGYLVVLGASLVLSAAREPWRATRWAWGWLMLLVPVVGVVAFLLLGGPTGLARPRDPSRRLTGGWAFLLGLLLTVPAG
jgi:hypothetical protein